MNGQASSMHGYVAHLLSVVHGKAEGNGTGAMKRPAAKALPQGMLPGPATHKAKPAKAGPKGAKAAIPMSENEENFKDF